MHHVRVSNSKRTTALIVALLGAVVLSMLAPAAADAARKRSTYAPHIDKHIMPLRGENLGSQVATWYGPGFFGNGTACGQRLTPQTWGIAHRTLPCGTLVTLALNGRRVTVPVIDRGPFSGATIDLTSRTKSYLRFAAGRVPMTRVASYKVVPVPKSVAGVVAIGTTATG